MGIKVITPVTSPVIPLTDLRQHLRLDLLGGSTHPDDDLIEGYLSAAREYCEHYTQRSIGVQTLELALDEFPDGPIELPLGAASITSVRYADDAMALQTVDPSNYTLDDYSHQSWAVAIDVWPDAGDYANSVKVRYVTPTEISGAIKSAMLLLIGHWYENRESVNIGNITSLLPLSVKSLLDIARVYN
jgi:uncharacterized phiE125 gp8 family phage protein